MQTILHQSSQINQSNLWEGTKMSLKQIANRIKPNQLNIETILRSKEVDNAIAIQREFYHYGQFTR